MSTTADFIRSEIARMRAKIAGVGQYETAPMAWYRELWAYERALAHQPDTKIQAAR